MNNGVSLRDKIENFKDACRELRALYTRDDLQVEMETRFNGFEDILSTVTVN